jgi:DNA processing protein
VARGCHQLIKQGAKLVETAQDVLEELRFEVFNPQTSEASPPLTTNPLVDAIGHDPCSLDELVERTGLSTHLLLTELLTLELGGQVATLPGNRYQRLA